MPLRAILGSANLPQQADGYVIAATNQSANVVVWARGNMLAIAGPRSAFTFMHIHPLRSRATDNLHFLHIRRGINRRILLNMSLHAACLRSEAA